MIIFGAKKARFDPKNMFEIIKIYFSFFIFIVRNYIYSSSYSLYIVVFSRIYDVLFELVTVSSFLYLCMIML
jgi:hypothetical protein